MKAKTSIYLVILPVLLLTLNLNCKKDNSSTTNNSGSAQNIKVISEQIWNNNFVSMDSTSKTMVFAKNIDAGQPIQVGDILVSAVGDGFLRKVKTVTTTNDKIQIQTDPAYLTEAVKEGVVKFDQILTVRQIKKIQLHYEGVKLITNNNKSFTSFPLEVNTVLYDADNNLSTTYDQVKLIGSFNCDWHITGLIDIGLLSGLKEVKFSFESSENADLKLIAGLQYNFEKEFNLATVYFSPIVVTVGIVPVVFTPQLDIIVGSNGYANASVTTQVSQSLSFNAGVQWLKNSGWAPFQNFSKSLSFQPPQLNVNAGAEAYVKPQLTLKVYGVAGPYIDAKIYERLNADLLQTPWWKLYGGLTMDGGVKLNIIDKILLEYKIPDLIKYETLLAQSTLPPITLPNITTSNISSITKNSADGGGNVTNDGGAPITVRGVCYNTSPNPTTANNKTSDGSGTGSFTSALTGLTANTTYYVRAYATNSVGTAYGNQLSLTTSQSLSLPILTTSSINNLTQTGATSGGNISSDGNAAITARGVCWSTSQNPTIANSKTSDGSGTGSFTSGITGLTANTTYYVRAYATNSVGTAYGNQLSFTTSRNLSLPTLTTSSITNLTQTGATSGGNISSDGNAAIAVRGICWSTSQNPTTANNKTSDGSGTGSFASNLTGLTANTTYYVRAYATNSVGTAYGNQLSFTTSRNLSLPTLTTSSITNLTQTGATSGGNISSDGNAAIAVRGICWSTSQNPTTANSKTSDGSGTGSFTSSIMGLTANTTYYVRSYATNSVGTAYGNQLTFITSQSLSLPILTTSSIINLTQTSATSGGNISSDGNAAITARGVCWSTSQNPTTANSKTSDGNGTGSFTSSIMGLTANTTYYVRSYATNSVGTAYGSQVSFTTATTVTLPVITTSAAANITQTMATSGGNVTSDGGVAVTSKGVCWSTSQNPTTANSKTSDGNGTGSFTSSIMGLTANTTYYVRSYATNSVGTAYGSQVSFTTATTVTLPVITTSAAANITQTMATSGGNVTSDGGVAVTSRGVCWSTSQNPTTANSKTSDGTGTGSFTSSLTSLTANTTYYVRAYATNSVGTAYGSQISITTTSNSGGTVSDTDGNTYSTVTIGTQVWMVENLKTTKYNDGASIPNVTDNTAWGSLTTPGFCWYNNDVAANKNVYGALYNWFTVNTGKLCPTGWHVPSDTEWTALTNFLGGESVAGGKLKEAGTIHWSLPNAGATNETGFTALSGGWRDGASGSFSGAGNYGAWFTSTFKFYPWGFFPCLSYNSSGVTSVSGGKQNGFSVRCLHD